VRERNARINAYLEIFDEKVLADAKKYTSGKPLAGIPLGIKDMISIRNQNLTASSKVCRRGRC
jgi:Asp-tRNA(Asn)/Glu-tRNA(Gln) amidotransferase A subunit family amidase